LPHFAQSLSNSGHGLSSSEINRTELLVALSTPHHQHHSHLRSRPRYQFVLLSASSYFSQIVSSEFLSYLSPRQQKNCFCRQSRARAHQPLAVCRARAPSHFFHECHVSPRSSCFSYQQLPLWLVVVVLSLSSRHPVPRIASCVCGGSRNLG
jgi:hypothetical protein